MGMEDLQAFAEGIGMEPTPCRACRGADTRCPECDGSGRLWISGAAVLNDVGLAALAHALAGPPASPPA